MGGIVIGMTGGADKNQDTVDACRRFECLGEEDVFDISFNKETNPDNEMRPEESETKSSRRVNNGTPYLPAHNNLNSARVGAARDDTVSDPNVNNSSNNKKDNSSSLSGEDTSSLLRLKSSTEAVCDKKNNKNTSISASETENGTKSCVKVRRTYSNTTGEPFDHLERAMTSFRQVISRQYKKRRRKSRRRSSSLHQALSNNVLPHRESTAGGGDCPVIEEDYDSDSSFHSMYSYEDLSLEQQPWVPEFINECNLPDVDDFLDCDDSTSLIFCDALEPGESIGLDGVEFYEPGLNSGHTSATPSVSVSSSTPPAADTTAVNKEQSLSSKPRLSLASKDRSSSLSVTTATTIRPPPPPPPSPTCYRRSSNLSSLSSSTSLQSKSLGDDGRLVISLFDHSVKFWWFEVD